MDSNDLKRTQDEFEHAPDGLAALSKFKLKTAKPLAERARVDKEGRCHVAFDFELDGLEYVVPLLVERKRGGEGEGGGFTLHVDGAKRSFDLRLDGSSAGTAVPELDRAAEDIADATVEKASGPSE